MSNAKQGEFSLTDQIAEVTRKLKGLDEKLRALEDELSTHADQRVRYELLGTICASLDKLEELGASDLFWGGDLSGYSPEKQLQRVRGSVAEFERKIGAIESVRDGVQAEIDQEEIALQRLNADLAEEEREAELRAQELVVDREGVELPYRSYLMPWSRQGEDERRYRKIMAAVVSIILLFTTAVTLLRKPPEKHEEVVIPDKIADLVVKKKEQPKPKPVEPAPSETQNTSPTPTEHATTKEAAAASVKNQGVLGAGGVNDLLASADDVKLGSDAHVSSNGKVAGGDAGKAHVSVIGSQAAGGSGGIGAAGLSTGGVGTGSGGNSITGGGVKVATVQSSTAAGVAAARPKAGAGPARTDEDIQIVFDKYKAALYRIYNRELRNDPTLRGKMVLKVTIEPDGHVSACVVATNELSAALAKEIVDKVLTFNFGAKPGVPPTRITYPIDFLPAT